MRTDPTGVSEIAFRLAADPRAVAAHLAEPASYVGLSPLVVAVDEVATDAGGVVRYVAVERFGILGPLHYDNRIRVTLRRETRGSALWVGGDVDSPGNVQLVYGYTIEPDGDGARVVDRIAVTAPWGLRRFSIRRASQVQEARARILRQRLELQP